MRETPNWPDPAAHIARHAPDTAMLYFSPAALQATAQRFQSGFDGLVTYAVKANAGEEVLANLVAAGIRAFDVASPREMYAVRAVCPRCGLALQQPGALGRRSDGCARARRGFGLGRLLARTGQTVGLAQAHRDRRAVGPAGGGRGL